MFTSDTNRAQRILRLLEVAVESGLERHVLLERLGLSEAQIQDPDARVPVVKSLQLWQILSAHSSNPDVGLLVGSRVRLREGGIVGYAMLHSETLSGAIQRLVRFAKLLSQRVELGLEQEGDRWRLQSLGPALMPGFRPPIDEALAGLVTVFRELTERSIEPAAVHFSYGKPASTSGHRRLLGPRLRFGQERAGLVLWNSDMQAASVAIDERLTSYLDELAQIHLDALPQDPTYAGRVRRQLWPRLSEGMPSIVEVAASLALSSRSLQRRLREEQTSFAEVVETLRRDKAPLLLRDHRLAVYEIGYLLGYSDPSAFYRAFKRWYGTSPRQFRARRTATSWRRCEGEASDVRGR